MINQNRLKVQCFLLFEIDLFFVWLASKSFGMIHSIEYKEKLSRKAG